MFPDHLLHCEYKAIRLSDMVHLLAHILYYFYGLISEQQMNARYTANLFWCPQGTRDSVSSELISCKEELSKVQEEHERCLLEMQGNSHTQLARAQEEKAREKAELKDNLDRYSQTELLQF